MEHRKHRRGLWHTFLALWLIAVVTFILGMVGVIDMMIAAAVFTVAALIALFGCSAPFFFTRCGGCGRVLANFRSNTGQWREFPCPRCSDVTLVKGQVEIGASD